MMERKTTIEIRQVANGYVVMPAVEPGRMVCSDQDRMVFQSFAELSAYLSEHFSYRAPTLMTD